MIYGPSGCGKSSLIKAGLLPRLAKCVLPVYVEATADETETRLIRGLHKAFPDLPADQSLVDSLAAVRRGRVLGSGQKVLVVLDQFEQWLFAKRGEESPDLVAALRQCDGEHLQALVMVRDDFWMAATRFMRELEIRLLEGENSAAVDLFDLRHARRVLAEFGRAYGALPEQSSGTSFEQQTFLDQSVAGLAEDGKIIPVRLALFAETVKGKPWAPSTLREVGGTEGVGLAFLEETFSARTATPEHRLHQKAAQAVLKALLPESGTDIKGQMRSRQELLQASSYANRPRDFDDLIHMLDRELRLITPTDALGSTGEDRSTRASEHYYQLAHDYLVHPLRDWLTRKQRETRRGRAELRLSERSASWSAVSENRHLPSLLEWANIRSLTRKRHWSDAERRMMKRAGQFHSLRFLTLGTVVALLAAVGLHVRTRVVEANQSNVATALVRQVVSADTAKVPDIIRSIKTSDRRWTDPELRQIVAAAPENSKDKLHASLALLPIDPGQAEYLYSRLLGAQPHDLPVIRKALDRHKKELVERLWAVLDNTEASPNDRFGAACALAGYVPGENELRWLNASRFITERLLAQVIENPNNYALLLETLRPIRLRLLAPLSAIFRDEQRPETERSFATSILTDYSSDQPAALADLLISAGPKAYEAFFPIVQGRESTTLPLLQGELAKHVAYSWDDPPLEPSWSKPDKALVGKIESAGGLLAERFAFCQTMPLEDFLPTALRLRTSGYRPIRLRPFADCQAVRVAAVWARDGRPWRVAHDQSLAEIRRTDERNRQEGFVPVDIAGYRAVAVEGKQPDRFAALWVEKGGPNDDARIFAAMPADELQKAQDQLKRSEMALATLGALRDGKERTSYCGTARRQSSTADWSVFCNGVLEGKFQAELALHADLTLVDLSVDVAAPRPLTEKRASAALRAAVPGPSAKPDDPSARSAPEAALLDRSYTAVWSGDVGFESNPIFGLAPADHLTRCRELAAQGYRMVSLSVARARPDAPLVTASVWHRPVVDQQTTDRLAQRQARSAIALIRMGKAEEVWPLLRHSTDPGLRSFIINWLSPWAPIPGRSPPSSTDWILRLSAVHHPRSERWTPSSSIPRFRSAAPSSWPWEPTALTLSRPESASLDRQTTRTLHQRPRRRHSRSGRVALRQWNEDDKLKAADAELILRKERGDRRWLVNSQGQTFALIEGPVEFRMGSPATEPDRYAGYELPHRRIIPRRFAIAAKEVTVADYQEFVKENSGVDHASNSRLSPGLERTNESGFLVSRRRLLQLAQPQGKSA